ncbi:MAG: ABC transporter permease [Egibacteraceae bacterium]
MARFVVRRCIQMVVLFAVFLSLLFVLMNAQPGNITDQYTADPSIPPEARQVLAERLGLDRPLPERYAVYMRNFFTGNLGVSFSEYPRPVVDILAERFPRTLFLFLSATLLAYWVGFRAGKLLVWRRGKTAEHTVNVVGIVLGTVFEPWFFLLMIYLFSFMLGWFPAGRLIENALWFDAGFSVNQVFGRILLTTGVAGVALAAVLAATRAAGQPRARSALRGGGIALAGGGLLAYWLASPMRPYAADIVWHAILPVFCLTLVAFGGVMLLMRSSMLETLREDYIFTARAKGLPERVIRDRHAARNALLPLVTSLVFSLAGVIGGGIITESVFSWPGMGEALLNAIVLEDIPLAIGALGLLGALALVAHLAVDILYTYLDPRMRVR